MDASGEVADVCGPYREVGVHEEGEASDPARLEAACVRVVEDRRSCDDWNQEGTAVLEQAFVRGEVPGQGVGERGETFYACGVKGGHARGVQALKVGRVQEGSSDHGETRWTARGEMRASARVEMGVPSRVLCQKDH